MTLPDLLDPVRRIHDSIREVVVAACESCSANDLARVANHGAGDVTYMVDYVSETALIDLFTREIAVHDPIILIGEGLPNGRITLPENAAEFDARWQIIVDPIDGTRGLMYQKRPAWILTGVAPNPPSPRWGGAAGVTLVDIELAVQTEIPLVKQHLCDQLWAQRGEGAHAVRTNRLTNESHPFPLHPSTATDLRHGFATVCRFFPGARDILAAIDDALCRRLYADQPDAIAIFEDQQCTAAQLYGLATGQDRFIADLRPLVQSIIAARNHPLGHCCHPYDLCTKLIAEEAGVIITSATGTQIEAPLDTETDVAWLGYANRSLQSQIQPVLREIISTTFNTPTKNPAAGEQRGL
jgi:fructose-1,6-bisphosphatase/inositol monophosphatase family enzyme